MILTRARTAWLALLPALFIVFALSVWSRPLQKKLATSIVLGASVLVLLFFVSSPQALFGRALSLSRVAQPELSSAVQESVQYDTAFIHRTSLWRNTVRMMAMYPAFGVGLGNFGHQYHAFQDQAWVYATDPHNTYLSVLAEMGVVGAVVLFLLGALVIQRAWRVSLQRSPFLIGLSGVVVALLIHMLGEHSLGLVSAKVLFAVFVGLFLGAITEDHRVLCSPLFPWRGGWRYQPSHWCYGTVGTRGPSFSACGRGTARRGSRRCPRAL